MAKHASMHRLLSWKSGSRKLICKKGSKFRVICWIDGMRVVVEHYANEVTTKPRGFNLPVQFLRDFLDELP